MPDLKRIEDIARPIIDAKAAFLVDVSLRGSQHSKILEIFIDADTGVTTDLCAAISRELSQALDGIDLFGKSYHLVVSSPGIDRPLKFARQYRKNVGRRMIVTIRDQETTVKIEGELIDATEQDIVLRLAGNTSRTVPVGRILEARVIAPW